jgi:hypothetical protein
VFEPHQGYTLVCRIQASKGCWRWAEILVKKGNIRNYDTSSVTSTRKYMILFRGPQIFQKPKSHLQILVARIVASSRFHAQNPEVWSDLWNTLLYMWTDTHLFV